MDVKELIRLVMSPLTLAAAGAWGGRWAAKRYRVKLPGGAFTAAALGGVAAYGVAKFVEPYLAPAPIASPVQPPRPLQGRPAEPQVALDFSGVGVLPPKPLPARRERLNVHNPVGPVQDVVEEDLRGTSFENDWGLTGDDDTTN